MKLQVCLNTIATDVFRNQADYDYIAARANYRMQLRQQFLWASQQAVEKYLKAILLFNGMSARYLDPDREPPKEFGHNLVALFEKAKTISYLGFKLGEKDERFVKYLSKQGPNRYLSISAWSTGEAIHLLDSTVWHIRRYCRYMPEELGGQTRPVQGLRDAYVRFALDPRHEKFPQRFSLLGGELEKIVKRSPRDPARRALVWANFYYGAKRRRVVQYQSWYSFETPPWEQPDWSVDWEAVGKFVKLR